MARKGLVSKNLGPQSGAAKPLHGQSPPALGDKRGASGTANLLSFEQAAARLGVAPAFVSQWVKEGLLRHAGGGAIRPYDLNKFTLDCADELKRARLRPVPATPAAPGHDLPRRSGLFGRIRELLAGHSPEKGQAVAVPSSTVSPIQTAELGKLRTRLKEANSRIKSLEQKLALSQEDQGQAPPDQSDRLRALEQELAHRDARVRQLESRLQDAQDYEGQIQLLETRLAEAEGLHHQADQRLRELQAQREGDDRAARLEQQLEAANRHIAELETAADQVRERTSDEERVQALERELDTFRADREQELQRVHAEVTRLQADRQTRIEELQAELASATDQRDRRIGELEQELAERAARANTEQLEARLARSEATRSELEQQVAELENELVQARVLPQQAMEELEARIRTAESQRESLQAERDRAIEGWQDSDRRIRDLQEQYQKATREAAGYRSRAEAEQARREAIAQRMAGLDEQRQQLIEELGQARSEPPTDDRLEQLEVQLQQATQRALQGEQRVNEITNEARRYITDLRAQVQQRDQAIHELREELAASQHSPQAPEELEDELTRARMEIDNLKGGMEELRLSSQRLEAQLADSQTARPDRPAEVRLSLPSPQERERVAELQREKAALELRLRQSQDQVHQLQASSEQAISPDQMDHFKRSLSNRDGQVKKLAAKSADLERALSKSSQESARLTELLIDRETKLKALKRSMEEEAEERFHAMERQLTGLEWKLSLREDRIAALEEELTRGRRILPPPSPRSRES